jgi:ribosomal protein S18 acetylase RimI-like enzyme
MVLIRPAVGADFVAAERIETAADAPLIAWVKATTWWPAASAAQRAASAGFVLMADVGRAGAGGAGPGGAGPDAAGPVGFVQVIEVDGWAHLEQVSVLPEFGRRGIGRRLVDAAAEAARERGYRELTLRTFVEVPWNAPFYLSCGFVVTEPASEFHRGLVREEERLGLTALGARVQMTRVL